MTYAEVLMWQALKGRKLGVRFRRQVPIGSLIADFGCLERRLLVEIDGSQHRGSSDRRRDAWLRSQGFEVLRFWNDEVIECLEGCVGDIRLRLHAPPRGELSRRD